MNALMTALLSKYISPLLDKTGANWKTTVGLAGYLIVWVCRLLAVKYGSPEVADITNQVSPWAEDTLLALTGVGVFHKALRKE